MRVEKLPPFRTVDLRLLPQNVLEVQYFPNSGQIPIHLRLHFLSRLDVVLPEFLKSRFVHVWVSLQHREIQWLIARYLRGHVTDYCAVHYPGMAAFPLRSLSAIRKSIQLWILVHL